MANPTAVVTGGVDTHKHVHHAAALSARGELLGASEFSTDLAGHQRLLSWLQSFGEVRAVGIEGTGFFGASLTRFLQGAGLEILDVNRPNRAARRADGKSDRLDAEQAARAVQASTATAIPKDKTGIVEVIRTLRVTRSSAVKAKNRTMNCLHGAVICAPDSLRDELIMLTKRTFVNRCLRLRPETENLIELVDEPGRLHLAGSKLALRDLARRWKQLDEEVKALSAQIQALVGHAAPELVQLFGVSHELAGQFLVTAGDNVERIRSEAAFAKICGVAPQPATSGKRTNRHRLSRSGDRAANSALYIVTIVRMRHHEPTRAYVARRTAEGLSKREIMRCLKRYIAREVFAALPRARVESALSQAA
jgi:transposase